MFRTVCIWHWDQNPLSYFSGSRLSSQKHPLPYITLTAYSLGEGEKGGRSSSMLTGNNKMLWCRKSSAILWLHFQVMVGGALPPPIGVEEKGAEESHKSSVCMGGWSHKVAWTSGPH